MVRSESDADRFEGVLSVCVPALNEEGTLESAVEDLVATLGPRVRGLDILVVDDGSTDGTGRAAARLQERHRGMVRVIRHETNRGIGASFRDALAQATGDCLTWFPGDHENSAAQFLGYLRFMGPDTVVTCGRQGADTRPWMRRLLSRTYTALINLALGLRVKYYNGLTVFPRALLQTLPLRSDGFLITAEGLVRSLRSGCRLVELQAPLRGRSQGRSKALGLRSWLRMARDVARSLRG